MRGYATKLGKFGNHLTLIDYLFLFEDYGKLDFAEFRIVVIRVIVALLISYCN